MNAPHNGTYPIVKDYKTKVALIPHPSLSLLIPRGLYTERLVKRENHYSMQKVYVEIASMVGDDKIGKELTYDEMKAMLLQMEILTSKQIADLEKEEAKRQEVIDWFIAKQQEEPTPQDNIPHASKKSYDPFKSSYKEI